MEKPLRVLLVEDMEADALLLLRELRRGGYEPLSERVDTLQGITTALEQQTWDIILSDYGLPGFSALAALRIMQGHELDLPFIVVSGTINDEAAVAALKAGAHDFITKGNWSRLIPAIERELREAQGRREQRRSEAQLLRLASFPKLNPTPIIETDRTGAITYLNPAAERDFPDLRGLGPEHPLLAGVPPALVELQRGEKDYITREVEIGQAVYEALIWYVADSRLVRIYCQNITERKRAEESLRASEEHYRLLFENNPLPMWVYDTETLYFVAVNDAAGEHYGYGRDEFLAMTIKDIRPPEELRHLEVNLSEPRRPQERSGPWRHRKKDGMLIDVEITSHDVTFLDRPARLVLANDITDRKQAEDEIRRHAARAEALARTAARLNAQLDLAGVLNAVCEEAAHALNVPAAAVRLYDPVQDALFYAHAIGLPPDYQQYTEPSPRALYDDLMRQEGRLMIAPDVQALSPVPNAKLYAALNIRTVVTATMLREGQWIGGLTIYSFGQVRHFTPDELELLKSLADQATQAIANAHLYEENVRKLDRLVALSATAQQLTQSRDLQALAQQTVRTCVEAFGARLAWLGRAEADGRVVVLAAHGQGADALPDLAVRWDETPEGRGTVGTAIRTGFPIVFADSADDPRLAPWREVLRARGLTSAAALPLISRDRPFGVLALDSDQPDFFNAERVDFLKTYAHQAAAALENARLFAETQRRIEQMEALHEIDQAITASFDMGLSLSVVLLQITTLLRVDAAAVLLLTRYTQTLEYAAGRGFRTQALQRTRQRLGEGNAGRAALERRTIHVPNLVEAEGGFRRAPLLQGEDFIAYYGVPLIAKGEVKGVLEIFHRAPLNPDPEWLDFLETLGGQAAIAVDNAQLFDGLQRSNIELQIAYDTTIEGWSRALDLRDKETEGHSLRVTEMTLKLARALGLSEDDLVHVRRGALLHDIGKMGVPDGILLKPGKLTDEEWDIMRKHPGYAYELLSPIAYLHRALDIPYCHHEKWDGTGYPRGLKADQIPLAARLFAVVDVWDALRSDRPYRVAWPEEKVREHIRSLADTHFDPQVVETFLNLS